MCRQTLSESFRLCILTKYFINIGTRGYIWEYRQLSSARFLLRILTTTTTKKSIGTFVFGHAAITIKPNVSCFLIHSRETPHGAIK